MKHLYRCFCCDCIIKIEELRQANRLNERYCTNCHNFLEDLAKQWRESK